MNKLTKYISGMILMLLAVSCSTEIKKADEPKTKTYSESTEREFEAIEKNDLHKTAAPFYNKTPSKLNPRPNLPKEKAPVEIAKPAVQPAPTEILGNEKLSAKNQERLQEINQNLAFFCMKHRKDPAFQDEERCLSFTKKVLLSCEKKHQIINTVMVNCIKDRLKKKR